MVNRNLTNLTLLLACWLFSVVGCKEPEQKTDRFPMRYFPIDFVLENLTSRDALLEKVGSQKAAFHPDSVKAGHWVAVLEARADLATIRVRYQDRQGMHRYPGNWEMREAFYKRDLRSYSLTARQKAIVSLMYEARGMKDIADAELIASVYYLFHDENIVDIAIEAAAFIDPVHSADSIMQFLGSNYVYPDLYDGGLIALGHTPAQPQTVAFLGEQLSRMAGNRSAAAQHRVHATLDALAELHPKADSLLQREIERHIMDCISTRPISKNKIGQVVRALAISSPLPSYLPLFEAQNDDKDLRRYALLGIAKIKGVAAQEEVMAYLQDSTVYHDPWAVPFAFAEDPKAALPLLVQGFLEDDYLWSRADWVDAVWETGGKPLADAFVAQIPDAKLRDTLQQRFHLLYEPVASGHPLHQAAQRLLQAGLVEAPISPDLLDTVQADFRSWVLTGFEDDLLDYLHLGAWIDAPDEDSPDRYFLDICAEFVGAARHKLDDLEVYIGPDPRQKGTGKAMLWLIYEDRAYFVETAAYDSEVQVEAARHALHAVLDDAGIEERFVAFPTASEGYKRFIFMKPAFVPKAMQLFGKAVHPGVMR